MVKAPSRGTIKPCHPPQFIVNFGMGGGGLVGVTIASVTPDAGTQVKMAA